jgi:two-component system sporulation sensor kinase A
MFGFQYWPATSELVSTLCFFGALGYTLAVGFVVYAQSQRLRAARDELRAEGARYRLVTENASDLIGIVDADARWLYCSPSYSGVLDPSDLAAGADAFRRAHPADADRGRAEVLRAAADGRPRELDVRLDGRAGTRQFRMRLSPLDGPGPRRVLLVSQDVTQLREAEERLRRSTMSHGDQARR